MSKARYIPIAVIAIISLSLVSAIVCGYLIGRYVEIEPNNKAKGSAELVHGDKLEGFVSSDVLIRVIIHNEGKLVYDEKSNEHHFGTKPFYVLRRGELGGGLDTIDTDLLDIPLKGGDLNITVINSLSERVGVDYVLRTTTGHRNILLSPVRES